MENKKKHKVIKEKATMPIIFVYVLFSASGLLFLKMGTSKHLSFSIDNGNIELGINWLLVLGLCLYIASFITSLIAMRTIELSVFYPVSIGLAYILVCVLSFIVLKESMSTQKIIGSLVILIGVILVNLKQ